MLSHQKNGFTLIELLIVIAIVAVLAAILFPIFQTAKQAALRSKCLSNIRQVNNAGLQYADDNDGKWLALNCYDGDPMDGHCQPPKWGWTKPEDWKNAAIYRYIKGSKEVIACPSDARKIRTSEYTYPPDRYTYSYTIPAWLTWVEKHYPETYDETNYYVRFDRARVEGFPIAWFKRPAKTVSFVDENTDATDPSRAILNDAVFIWIGRVTNRHNGSGCVAYLDGHVGIIKGRNMTYDDAVDSEGHHIFHTDAFTDDW